MCVSKCVYIYLSKHNKIYYLTDADIIKDKINVDLTLIL